MRRKFRRLHLRFDRYRRVRLKRQVRDVKIKSRHPFAVPFIVFAVLATLTAGGFFFFKWQLAPSNNNYVVIIKHDGVEQTVPSRQPTVGTLLAKLHLTLNQGDIVEPSLTTRINQ